MASNKKQKILVSILACWAILSMIFIFNFIYHFSEIIRYGDFVGWVPFGVQNVNRSFVRQVRMHYNVFCSAFAELTFLATGYYYSVSLPFDYERYYNTETYIEKYTAYDGVKFKNGEEYIKNTIDKNRSKKDFTLIKGENNSNFDYLYYFNDGSELFLHKLKTIPSLQGDIVIENGFSRSKSIFAKQIAEKFGREELKRVRP